MCLSVWRMCVLGTLTKTTAFTISFFLPLSCPHSHYFAVLSATYIAHVVNTIANIPYHLICYDCLHDTHRRTTMNGPTRKTGAFQKQIRSSAKRYFTVMNKRTYALVKMAKFERCRFIFIFRFRIARPLAPSRLYLWTPCTAFPILYARKFVKGYTQYAKIVRLIFAF